jgi:hypothetical protein
MKKILQILMVSIVTAALVVMGLMFTLKKVGAEKLSKLPVLKELVLIKSGEVKYVEPEETRYSEVDNLVQQLQQKIEEMGELDNELDELRDLRAAVDQEKKEVSYMLKKAAAQLIIIDETRWANLSERAATFKKMDAMVIAEMFEVYDDDVLAEQLVVLDVKKAGEVIAAFVGMGEKQKKRIAKIKMIMDKITLEKGAGE